MVGLLMQDHRLKANLFEETGNRLASAVVVAVNHEYASRQRANIKGRCRHMFLLVLQVCQILTK
ncbi:hypothetical protein WM08_29020 [Burkholderia ubonensis]|nr:hypothetical protein WK19_01320 [Burkholderia ubonensis]KVU95968.1 hypothetical protein WK77_30460 [Burkholderia ubonensis]KWI81036.1 hypothetical protein WM08_29020 [Burkholderia ubonensis]